LRSTIRVVSTAIFDGRHQEGLHRAAAKLAGRPVTGVQDGVQILANAIARPAHAARPANPGNRRAQIERVQATPKAIRQLSKPRRDRQRRQRRPPCRPPTPLKQDWRNKKSLEERVFLQARDFSFGVAGRRSQPKGVASTATRRPPSGFSTPLAGTAILHRSPPS
jgi:hypothetical protein